MQDSDGQIHYPSGREVGGYGGTEFPHLSMGICCSVNCAVALRQAASRELLALHYHFRRGVGRRGVHDGRSDP
jgi:hypothetical protein